jgi:hypothetical protein
MHKLTGALIAAAALAAAGSSHAAHVTWNVWDPGSIHQDPTNGSISGTMGTLSVAYTGEVGTFEQNYPSWTPDSTYVGGSVDNAPDPADGIFHIVGGTNNVNTITFSQAVVDPVIAIWSLGQSGGQASFDFDAPFTVEAGGPSAEYGGGPLGGASPVVTGNEANGVIQFHGTFTSISFTNPQSENWYGFAVGDEGVAGGIPEPASWALMIAGFGGVGAALRSRRRAGAATA